MLFIQLIAMIIIIDIMNIQNTDLNLLKTFAALWEQRNVSKASKTMGLSQSAMSNALARLRIELSDDLFVRSPKGVSPTPFAMKLAPKILKTIELIKEVYQEGSEKFDPALATGTVTIGTTDYFEQILMVKLLKILEDQAPNIKIISKSIKFETPKVEMANGEIDIAIAGFMKNVPDGYMKQLLITEEMKTVTRPGVIHGKLTLDKYTSIKHLLIAPSGNMEGIVDKELDKLGRKRNVVCGLSTFMSPGLIIRDTDYILTAPARLCFLLEDCFGLKVHAAPLKLPKIKVHQVWHQRVNNDPLISWVRKKILECSQI